MRVAAVSGSTPTTRQPTAEATPADEPAAADRHDDRVDVRQILLDLETERAVAGLEHRVVEGMHEDPPRLLRVREQALVRLGRAVGVEIDLGAVRPRRLDLARVRRAPHEDTAGHAVERSRVAPRPGRRCRPTT